MTAKQSSDEYIKKAIKKHGDRYLYIKTLYISRNQKVCIDCKIHGEFWQRPYDHLNGSGCPKCKSDAASHRKGIKNNIFTWETIYELFPLSSKSYYSYDETTYTRNGSKMKIICPIHGEFWQKPELHRNGSGCKICTASGGPGRYGEKFFEKNPEWKNREGFVYLIKLKNDEEEFYKIGITTNFKERMQSYLRSSIPITPVWNRKDSLYNCFLLEQKVLSTYKNYKYIPKTNMSSGGHTECLNKEVINELFKTT